MLDLKRMYSVGTLGVDRILKTPDEWNLESGKDLLNAKGAQRRPYF